MTKNNNNDVQMLLMDEAVMFTLEEISHRCSVHTEIVLEMVEYGVLDPIGNDPQDWQFDIQNLRRTQTALNLQQDLGINLAGAALVLDLLEELNDLRSRVEVLEFHLGKDD